MRKELSNTVFELSRAATLVLYVTAGQVHIMHLRAVLLPLRVMAMTRDKLCYVALQLNMRDVFHVEILSCSLRISSMDDQSGSRP